MSKVRSQDGTPIAFEQRGQGLPLVIVGGATSRGSDYLALAAALAAHFTVFTYDRRGRGDSGDTLPYAVEREIEDVEAVLDAAGGSAFVWGHSSGAVLGLETARKLPGKITKLAVYDPPFIVEDSRPPLPDDYLTRLSDALADGRRGDAMELFLTEAVGVPAAFVAQMRADPSWATSEAVAHTLLYDCTIMGDTVRGNPLPLQKWAALTVPTLVMNGGASKAYMHYGAQALAEVLPQVQRHVLDGQDHGPSPDALTPVLAAFFLG